MEFSEVRQLDADFFIARENIIPAFDALRRWVLANCPDRISAADSFEAILDKFNWDMKVDDKTGNIDSLWYMGNYGDVTIGWLEAIAPYVDAGSYIDITENDDAYWRLYFDGKTCEAYEGELRYPGCPRR